VKTVAVILGTRPEAIKLAPLIRELRAHRDALQTEVVFSGQHLHLVRPILEFFQIEVQRSLDLMQPDQTLAALTARAMSAFAAVFAELQPAVVVVQGDTTTAMCAALAAFYQKISVAHLEAGLRTNARYSPFPEEINRRIISQIAGLHWAPTARAAAALRRENLPLLPGRIVVTGNTGIDALFDGLARIRALPPDDADCQRASDHRRSHPEAAIVLITGHRRENFGEPFRQFCDAIKETAARYPEALFIYPVHPNPNVREPVSRFLAALPNVLLTESKNYPAFLRLLDLSDIILTDSGGVQEEAPALGKPVLVTRFHTERPEGIATGHVTLIGPERTAILEHLGRLLDRHRAGQRGLPPAFPYGDGHAAPRCVASLLGREVVEFTG